VEDFNAFIDFQARPQVLRKVLKEQREKEKPLLSECETCLI
jgi:hypothetical protein